LSIIVMSSTGVGLDTEAIPLVQPDVNP